MKIVPRHFSLKSMVLLLACSIASFFIVFSSHPIIEEESADVPRVLGLSGYSQSYRAPQIYLTGGNYNFSTVGVIALSTTDEPSISVQSYNVKGTAEITIYTAGIDNVFDYLIHDNDAKQTKPKPDVSQFQKIGATSANITGENDKITLPLEGKGIWYITLKIGSISADGYVIRSDTGVVAKEGDNKFVFWSQRFSDKKSATSGTIKVYNLLDTKRELFQAAFNEEGIAETGISGQADVALVEVDGDLSLIPLNLQYLNSGYFYKSFEEKKNHFRYFLFTDRPLYKPGDTVFFKAIIRSEDDARFSIPTGSVKVTLKDSSNQSTKHTAVLPISPDGTIDGSYLLPENSATGYYSLAVEVEGSDNEYFYDGTSNASSTHFQVEHYKKPEFFISSESDKLQYIAGDKAEITIKGEYFSGQPLSGQVIKYRITGIDYADYYHYNQLATAKAEDSYYGYNYGSSNMAEGTATLDKLGRAVVVFDTTPREEESPSETFTPGKSKMYLVEATLVDGSQTPAFSQNNFLSYAGEFGIYRTDYTYGARLNTPINFSLKLASTLGKNNLARVPLTAKINFETWVSDGIPANSKYPTYHKVEEDLAPLSLTTNAKGEVDASFIPTKQGSYKVAVSGHDSRGNLITSTYYFYASGGEYPLVQSEEYSGLSITLDKSEYDPGDNIKVSITSDIPDRDVFVSVERGRMDRYYKVHLSGKEHTFSIPLSSVDVPNIYLNAMSFSNYYLDSYQINAPVSAAGKHVLIELEPDQTKYGPGETIDLKIKTTNPAGNPVSAELALWAVDKAIFELSDATLGDIFKNFWSQRYDTTSETHSLKGIVVQTAEGGGCFASGTQVLMSDGSNRRIEDVVAGDYITTRDQTNSSQKTAKVLENHVSTAAGYMIINTSLKLTPDHILYVNGLWRPAGEIQVGDLLTDQDGNPVKVDSLEWSLGKYEVYNLEIEGYHTYIAEGIWVHNQKGDVRSVLKDTAYWNPSIHTDNSGTAELKIKLPDNLTTWTIAAVGSTPDSAVGQATKEIRVTKDIIVRPILPNIMRVGDELFLSALVQNFTDKDHTFTADLAFDAGDIPETTWVDVKIPANSSEQLYWRLLPTIAKESAKLKFETQAQDAINLEDAIEVEIPVRPVGFLEKTATTGLNSTTHKIALSPDIDKDNSSLTLSLSPTLIGSLSSAMKYLVGYPYGCVEQTTSRFVPAVIASANKELFSSVFDSESLDKVIKSGVIRLNELQSDDGGWSWWYSGQSDPFLTSYVVEYLVKAKSAGHQINEDSLNHSISYLKNLQANKADSPAKQYGLVISGNGESASRISSFADLGVDMLSLAVMSNYLLGDKDPATNGLAFLQSLAQTQGDAAFWASGSKAHFGSTSASTSLAVQAITLAGGDRGLAAKGVMYLTRSRQRDYWDSTFSTAEVIKALVDFGSSDSELSPDYAYTVKLDGKEITKGKVNNYRATLPDLEIPLDKVGENSSLEVMLDGIGQLYSTLLTKQFHLDKDYQGVSHGLTLTRTYENVKGADYSLAVGDTAIVKLTLSGLKAPENYGVIEDSLPSGLVPVNRALKNENWSAASFTPAEYSENGAVLSLYEVGDTPKTYTYHARVVAEGVFSVPPATASLMYAPEIYARSANDTVTITKESSLISGKLTNKKPLSRLLLVIPLVIFSIAILILLIKKLLKKRKMSKIVSHDIKANDPVSPTSPVRPVPTIEHDADELPPRS